MNFPLVQILAVPRLYSGSFREPQLSAAAASVAASRTSNRLYVGERYSSY